MSNADKIPSLYDTSVRVIVRGKAGAEVKFGHTRLLGEDPQGVMIDFRLLRKWRRSTANSPSRAWSGCAKAGVAV